MRPIQELELQRPATLAEAAKLLAASGARAIAGGTDLVPNMRRGLVDAERLVDLGALPGFAAIEAQPDGGWRIGAGVTLATLARHAALAAALPALAQAASQVAGPAHRSAATLGGNLCQDTRCIFYNQSEWWRASNGYCLKRPPRAEPLARPAPRGGSSSPAEPDLLERGGAICHVAPQGKRCHAAYEGDVAPALIALGAEVEVVSAGSTSRRPLASIYRDDGAAHLTLSSSELVVAALVPAPARGSASGYRKARARAAMDFPLAGVGVALRIEGGVLAALRVGISGTNSHPVALEGTDALLGKPVDDATLAALGKLVSKQVSPMRSTVTQSNHRRLVAVVTAQRLVRDLAQGDQA
ncbi:MAG TPA: FAD binding domain-containing protein [Burkholderiaceae bacterium]|nr:FAD binding domain-containing protein [Burkholderiaceae bacterium]